MSYHNRMSIIPQQQGGRSRKKEPEPDAFMLSDKEIVGCITDIGINFTISNLQKPNPVQVQQIFEWFAELLLNATRETVDPAMRAAAEDVCGEFSDIIPVDTRNLMGFYVSLRRLLAECGINDFCFNDLYKPSHERLSKIFSYVINFIRFRESQTNVIDEHFNRSQKIKSRIETLYVENQDKEALLEEMRVNREAMETEVREKQLRNEELKKTLLELRRNQEKVAMRLDETKVKKSELAAELEAKTTTKLVLKQESAKLRPYASQSPAALKESLADLSATLNQDRAHLDALNRRARALQTSADSFGVVGSDVASCIKLLDDIAVELQKEEEDNSKNASQREALMDHEKTVRDVERTQTLLVRQLKHWEERTRNIEEQRKQKAAEAQEKMEKLKKLQAKMKEERTEKAKDIERRRVRIEQIEKKASFIESFVRDDTLDLKENIENEVHAAHDEYLKMEAHIKLYMAEMEQLL
ncbi:hypothetical protein TD95_002951 [Thielaviopsis punctulata]|uniref:Probable kinetochore protein NUF2 n=1 Tax=Thielaviopsis punctulata TaxID=72032 RepID=A0A0F4ZK55_9PEZI|nr:hypothetical protein TD95_002951 [Thielaviopsis punctulata]